MHYTTIILISFICLDNQVTWSLPSEMVAAVRKSKKKLPSESVEHKNYTPNSQNLRPESSKVQNCYGNKPKSQFQKATYLVQNANNIIPRMT